MIDIHMHTIYSDGTETVEEVLKKCEEQKLEYISITDHDTCKQYYDDAWNKNIFTGKVIKGSEAHAVFKQKKIEILAYNIDTEFFGKWYENYYSDEKLIENQKICSKMLYDILDKHNIKYNQNNVPKPEKPTDFVENPIYKEVMSYEENHKILGKFSESFAIFYRQGLTNPKSSYFMEPIGCPSYKEVIETIHKAGGKAFLAHPYEYRNEDTIEFINDLRKEAELDGIECFHPSSMDDDKHKILYKYARENNLYISGGSDYHGKAKKGLQIGKGRGNLNIPKEIIEEWIKK